MIYVPIPGQWSFAINGPTIWNSLPAAALRAPDRSLAGFNHHLKTSVFSDVIEPRQ